MTRENRRENRKEDPKDHINIKNTFDGLNLDLANVELNITFVNQRPVENLKKVLRLKHQKNYEGKV
jgi:hypothetical protein